MSEKKPIVIKKYPNRRLYNTKTSKYITLEDLTALVKDGTEFKVVDAKTEEDLTRVVLTQIILEHETQGYNMLPIDFLKHIIKFYDHPLNQVFSQSLQQMVQAFKDNKGNMDSVMESMKGMMPFGSDFAKNVEDLSKQNIEFMNSMFEGFAGKGKKKK